MNFFNELQCSKGITLNSQLTDLLSILDEDISLEKQDEKIEEYIRILKDREDRCNEVKNTDKYFEFLINEVVNAVGDIESEKKEYLKKLYLSNIANKNIFESEKMKKVLQDNGFDKNINNIILKKLKNIDFRSKDGITALTPNKVRKLYAHMFKESGNTYDRVTFDEAGKYSLYTSVDGKTYASERLEGMIEFCEKHNMKSKINTFMMYCDFPQMLDKVFNEKVSNGEITVEERKVFFKQSLIGYVKDIATKFGNRIDTVDIFNELIYDPEMVEGDGLYDEEKGYHPRQKGWQKYLDIKDLCDMALEARKLMPNTTFTYNDMNWIKPQKRKEIIKIIKEIQKVEQEYKSQDKLRENEKLIDTIGFEAHLTTGINLSDIEKAFEEVSSEFDLPIEITELDVARTGQDPTSKIEKRKQGQIFAKIVELTKKYNVDVLTIWSQSDELSFMNDKCGKKVFASVLDDNFEPKDIVPIKEFDPQEFNYHTHTSLCNHADGTIKEYIEEAIEGNISKLGFSDHAPSPLEKRATNQHMDEKNFNEEYIPTLESLKEEYKDKIDIKIGLESEYYGDEGESLEVIKSFRQRTESKLDYMILGQHFALKRDANGHIMREKSSPKSSSYPIDYAMTVVEAIKSGKFAYVAHPDIFLESRDFVPEEQKELYLKNAIKAAEMICEAASKYDIPLEVNLGSISAIEAGIKEPLKNKSYAYPVPEFWKIAMQKGCKALIGIDAHSPEALKEKKNEEIAKKLLEEYGIELDYLEDFNPKGIGKEGRTKEKSNEDKLLLSAIEATKDVTTVSQIEDNSKILDKNIKKQLDNQVQEKVEKDIYN